MTRAGWGPSRYRLAPVRFIREARSIDDETDFSAQSGIL